MLDRTWLGALLLIGTALLACKSNSKTCRAKLTYQGKPFEATGDSEENAKKSVCLGWCSSNDAKVDEVWKKWKASPEGVKSTDTKFGELYSSVPGGKEVLETCQASCLNHVQTTQPSPVSVTCS
jgi:hypothetical protein